MTAFLLDQGATAGLPMLNRKGETTLMVTAEAGQESTMGCS
jgi:hypothetical protein